MKSRSPRPLSGLIPIALGLVASVLFVQPAWPQEAQAPVLSSDNAPAPPSRDFPPLRPGKSDAEAVFDGTGRNPGSGAHPFAPGRVRQDAPAWFEINHDDPPMPEWASDYNHPRQPAPYPDLDPRFHDAVRMSEDFRSDDYPSIVSNHDNRKEVWMAWASYSGRREKIRLARRNPESGLWGHWNPVPGVTGDVWRPTLAFDAGGRLWVVWAQQDLFAANFDLYGRWFDGEHWGRLERLTSAPEGDFNHQIARGPDGTLHLVWQGFREGQSDIFYMSYDGKAWSQERRISTSEANDWTPAVTVGSNGAVQVAWDSYDRGNYDVLMRRVDRDLGEIREIAATPFFEARPSLATDNDGRVWIAYEVGEEGWGKDQGLLVDEDRQAGSMLNRERLVQVRVLGSGQMSAAQPELATLFPARARLHYTKTKNPSLSSPQLAVDARGRVTLLLRAMESAGAYAQYWQLYATTMTESGWSRPATVPYSVGRLSMATAATQSAEGGLWLAWPRDNFPTFGAMITLPEETVVENVYAARWEPGGAPGQRLGEGIAAPFPARGDGHADEEEDVARIRSWRVRVGGKSLGILRGDTHRHTELSMDLRGVPDGSVLDFYRYMLDAAAMDFGLITDHQNGAEREYWWWLEEKLADMFHAPERYVAMFGYERSINYPMGHRNIIHARRGHFPVPFFEKTSYSTFPNIRYHNGAPSVQEDDTKLLYEEVRRSGGITIPHTSATTMGTDWRDNDPEIEPLVEIYQGDRHSYEMPGAPLTDVGSEAQNVLTQTEDAGFVSNAWAKGYRLGVIASSDHLSTHISYAMVWTEERTREAVLEAMRQRRAYAATDNIVLEFWIGDHFMGDELSADHVPAIRVKAVGTGEIANVEILRNNLSIYRSAPGEAEIDFVYQDMEPEPGLNYYYVRVVQIDGQTAWSSPIWVNVG